MNNIKFLVLDIDGTLTDGKIYIGSEGEVFKAFDIKDGYGIAKILPQKGIEPIVITGRESKIVTNRCAELGIKYVFQGKSDKLECLNAFFIEYNVENGTSYSLRNVAYMGDDIPDLECMKAIKKSGGIAACPADAVDVIKSVCEFISDKKGGNGAVRDCIDSLLQLFDK